MPRNDPLLQLPYGKWPAADRLLLEQAANHDDPFTDAARLAKSTRNTYLLGWQRFLGFLARHEPGALEVAPGDRLTIERVQAYAAHLAETCTPRSVAKGVDTLFLAARMLTPERDWTWLKAVKARLYAAAPARGPAGPVITSVQLLELGQQLMDESKPAPESRIRRRDAIRYRDGLMVALLAFIPIRRKNLAALEINRHVVEEGDDWFIVIRREETKTGTPLEFPIPRPLKTYLAVYLDTIRPRLLRGHTSSALWVSLRGRALSACAISEIIGWRSASYFGFRITPHDARDAAATTWAIAAPDRIGIARDLLAHSDLRTTTKYYNRARGIEASRAYSQVIAAIRRKQNRHAS
jgi:integrase